MKQRGLDLPGEPSFLGSTGKSSQFTVWGFQNFSILLTEVGHIESEREMLNSSLVERTARCGHSINSRICWPIKW